MGGWRIHEKFTLNSNTIITDLSVFFFGKNLSHPCFFVEVDASELTPTAQLSSEIHESHQDLHAKWHWACRNVTSEKKSRPVNRGDVFLAPRFFREGHGRLVDQRSPCSKWVGLLDWLLFLGSGFEFAAAGLLERLVNLMHKFILCKNDPLM